METEGWLTFLGFWARAEPSKLASSCCNGAQMLISFSLMTASTWILTSRMDIEWALLLDVMGVRENRGESGDVKFMGFLDDFVI